MECHEAIQEKENFDILTPFLLLKVYPLRIRQWDKLYRTSRIVCHQDATSMQVHVHDHSLSSCLYFHFQSRCLAAVFRSSGIRKTGAASEARQEREETPRGVGSEHPGPVCHPAAAFRHHRCKTELSFPTTGSHTSGSQLCHGSCLLAAPSSLAG